MTHKVKQIGEDASDPESWAIANEPKADAGKSDEKPKGKAKKAD